MTHSTDHIKALAHKTALEVYGNEDPESVIEILARMVNVAAHGASAGFLRLSPGVPVKEELLKQDHMNIDRSL
jgi:hypothetical protein